MVVLTADVFQLFIKKTFLFSTIQTVVLTADVFQRFIKKLGQTRPGPTRLLCSSGYGLRERCLNHYLSIISLLNLALSKTVLATVEENILLNRISF